MSRIAFLLLLAVAGAPVLRPPPVLLSAQAAPDSIPADTVQADTVPPEAALPDTVEVDAAASDTLVADTLVADTLVADTLVADTVALEHMPAMAPLTPEGWATGVWEWDQAELLGSKAVTLFELLEEVPGIVPLRGGDFGQPRAFSTAGGGGGGVRVFRDGVEVLPLEGSVPDLSRISVADSEAVRVVRRADGIQVHLRSRRADDARPYSRIEVGTGDLETNLLEGVFFHPAALGGNAAAALNRNDTRGPEGRQPGSITAVSLRYNYLRGEEMGIGVDFRRSISDRDTLYVPGRVERTDVTLRGRWSPVEDVVGEIFWNGASLEADSTGAALEDFPFRNEDRSQLGARLRAERGPLSGLATVRELSGDGLPDREISAELSGTFSDIGGAAATWTLESWSERSPSTVHIEGWSAPWRGVSAFASLTDFDRGVPFLPPLSDGGDGGDGGAGTGTDGGSAGTAPLPDTRFYSGRATRFGARAEWRGLQLSGALLDLDRDAVHPLGLPMDRDGPTGEAGTRRGWEVEYRIPVPVLDGLALRGHAQVWDEDPAGWSYFPQRTWHSSLSFHDTFYPTGNLEVWADVGVDGRDGMAVATAEDAFAPSYQSWYARLQIRVVTVNIFVRWENFTFRAGNQDFPGRILPTSRAMYGVRWTLWN